MGLSGEILKVAAVLKAVDESFDLKDAVSLLIGEHGRFTNEDALKLLYIFFKQGILVIA